MEHIIEGVLELLFSFAKKKPKERPEVELKNEFIICYNKTASIIILLLMFLASATFFVISFWMDNDTKILFYIFALLFLILFITYLFRFGTKYDVTTERIQETSLFFFKKDILWSAISCVRTIEKDDDGDITIALYNQEKNYVLDLLDNMENAWHLVKMAESKNIEIRKEKNLTLRQMKKVEK